MFPEFIWNHPYFNIFPIPCVIDFLLKIIRSYLLLHHAVMWKFSYCQCHFFFFLTWNTFIRKKSSKDVSCLWNECICLLEGGLCNFHIFQLICLYLIQILFFLMEEFLLMWPFKFYLLYKTTETRDWNIHYSGMVTWKSHFYSL